jgi:uncharacterized damage-inducible protein DinB
MTKTEAILQELEQEAITTRRVLQRVPDEHLAWKPHAKSMSLGELALHVAQTPGGIAELATKNPYQLHEFQQASATSSAELMSAYEESLSKARAILGGFDDSALEKTWRLLSGDKEIMAMPVGALLRSIMLNHWYHHRGQLTVYLRELGIPVPSVYGPSADENPFAVAASA